MPAHFATAPYEIQRAILELIPRNDLFTTRSVCHSLSSVSTQIAFASLVFNAHAESGTRFLHVISSEFLRPCIRSLLFDSQPPQLWQASKCENLTRLDICADRFWGYYPKIDFRDVTFPRLRTLVLSQFIFSHDWQLQWLLRHDTLKELVLPRCVILAEAWSSDERDEDGYSFRLADEDYVYCGPTVAYAFKTRWYEYFAAIEAGLPHLQYFRLGPVQYENAEPRQMMIDIHIPDDRFWLLHQDRYLFFQRGFCHTYSPDQVEHRDEKLRKWERDGEALDRLLETVAKRKVSPTAAVLNSHGSGINARLLQRLNSTRPPTVAAENWSSSLYSQRE